MLRLLSALEALVVICSATRDTALNAENASFILCYGEDNSESYQTVHIDEITRHPAYNLSNPTTIYIHGYMEDQLSDTVVTMRRAYATRRNINFLTLNWASAASSPLYAIAVENIYQVSFMCHVTFSETPQIGQIVGGILFDKFTNGFLNRTNLHLVGHSLGAQMAGVIGNAITELPENTDRKKLPRITGLDPAGPLFIPLDPITWRNLKLNAADAEMVDIIHTDQGFYGYPTSTGSVDLYPNGGTRYQPGCNETLEVSSDEDYCNHRRSVYYYAESVENGQNFNAIALKPAGLLSLPAWSRFKTNRYFDEGKTTYMGIDCPSTASGDYYLQTNGETPYGRAGNGIHYDASA